MNKCELDVVETERLLLLAACRCCINEWVISFYISTLSEELVKRSGAAQHKIDMYRKSMGLE